MRVTIIQSDIEWAAPEANLQHLDQAIDRAPKSDLYVLPEMFSTGFCTKPEGIAEPADGLSLRWMQRKSAAIDAAIAGSVAVEQQGKFYNRFYLIINKFFRNSNQFFWTLFNKFINHFQVITCFCNMP